MNAESFTQIPEQKEADSPLSLWERVQPFLPNPRNEIYVSTPLTSGPAKKYISKNNLDLDAHQVMLRSLQVNTLLIDTIAPYIQHASTNISTIPTIIGQREGWGELEYSKFWLYYISGASPVKARQFDEHVSKESVIQKTVFNDHAAGFDVRVNEYKKLINAYGEFVGQEINPVSLMRFMPGHEESLGCTLEGLLAKKLGIPTEIVVFDRKHPEYEEKIGENAPWLKNHPQVQENGGESLVIFMPHGS